MRIDLPLCSFKDCRYNFDGNCKDKGRKEKCEFDVYKKAVEEQPKIGGWTPCSERLPEEGVKVLVWFEYFRYGEYNRLFQTIGISYTYNGKWSGFVNDSSGWEQLSIIAWQPLPEEYHG